VGSVLRMSDTMTADRQDARPRHLRSGEYISLSQYHLRVLTLPLRSSSQVKECVHIETNKYYACKVISKRLMSGRENMVRNEIAVLKRISQGHPNVLTLIDYFETTNNLYLVTDLCTGGELFDRICAKGCGWWGHLTRNGPR